MPKCFWITGLGICTRSLDEGTKCKGICEWYINHNYDVSKDYPDNTYNEDGFKGGY